MAAPVASTTPTSEQLVKRDDWLSDVCGRNVVRLTCGAESLRNESASQHVSAALRQAEADFAFAKLDTKEVAAAESLQLAGFRVVDVSIVLDVDSGRTPADVSADTTSVVDERLEVECLSELSEADARSHPLAEIAEQCFRYSRFHLDPHFPNHDADAIKREWVVNYLRGARGDHVWAAKVNGAWAGFLASLHIPNNGNAVKDAAKDSLAVIDLIGVAPEFQGRGVGGALIAAFQQHYSPHAKTLRVGTQAANTPSLRLYQKMGFRFAHSAFVLHWRAD